ncbi:MAG TPA: hypothetical protein VF170_09455 [Planctomycetaceae bacterium]
MLAQAILAQSMGWLHPLTAFWLMVAVVCVAPSLAYYWYKLKKTELEAGLKQTMLDRGMSAEEIERVLRAGNKKDA